jgi:hypothetical protein
MDCIKTAGGFFTVTRNNCWNSRRTRVDKYRYIAWYIHWLIIPTLLFTIMINISNVDVIKCAFHQVLRLPNSLLRLFYLSLQQLQYCYLNCVYPNLPCQLSLWKLGNQSTRRKPTTFGRALTRSENRTHELRRERQRSPVHYELYFRWL